MIKNEYEFYKKLYNRSYDPAVDLLGAHLDNLLKIIKEINEPLEGNILYEHLSTDLTKFTTRFLNKRRALTLFALANDRVLEIGFNSGFSTLLMLVSNPNIKITAIDLCFHKYTKPCYEYISSVFPGRVELIEGNSLNEVPKLLLRDNNFSAYHIDGGHGLDVAELDLLNIISRCAPGSIICFDDTDLYELKMLLMKYVLKGSISSIGSDFDLVDSSLHMFFRVS